MRNACPHMPARRSARRGGRAVSLSLLRRAGGGVGTRSPRVYETPRLVDDEQCQAPHGHARARARPPGTAPPTGAYCSGALPAGIAQTASCGTNSGRKMVMRVTWWARRAAAAMLLAALVAADGDKVDVKDEVRSRDEPAPAARPRRAQTTRASRTDTRRAPGARAPAPRRGVCAWVLPEVRCGRQRC